MVVTGNITIYIKDKFEDLSLLEVELTQPEKIEGRDAFTILYAYSVDGTNFSEYLPKDDIQAEIDELSLTDFYISLKVNKNILQTHDVTTIYKHEDTLGERKPDVNAEITIKYNGEEVTDFKASSLDELISQYPLWNLNNNQDITVQRWIAQCNAFAEMYGHYVIYFKTQPTEVIHTLKHYHKREVVDIKKIPLVLHGNEIGNVDKLVYSDWDLPLQDDFMVDIVWDKFQTAFGAGTIPAEKDYIYFPMLNRMFRIGVVQPVNKFMGKVAWFEAQLLKYEEDEDVSINQSLVDDMSEIPDFHEALNMATAGELLDITGTDYIEQNQGTPIEQVTEHIQTDLNTSERIEQKTVIEKRHATENYSNKLVDSTSYISLKESEKYREFFEKRLAIVNVKPDEETFPVSMYDNSKVENNVVAMQYRIADFTSVSKFSNNVKESYELSFDFVLMKKFGSSLISLIDASSETPVIINTVYTERGTYPKLTFRNDIGPEQESLTISHKIKEKELYNLSIKYDLPNQQYIFKLYTLHNKKKTPVYENILIVENQPQINITNIHLFGGKFLSSTIKLMIDDKEIFNDICSPVLVMNNDIR